MTNEVSAFNLLRAKVCWPDDRMERIENGLGAGMPDVNYCLRGVEGWIELKAPIEPKRARTPLFGSNHRISIEQANWFLKQRLAGGRGFLYIATDYCFLLMRGSLVAEAGLEMNKWSLEKFVKHSAWYAVRAADDWQTLRYTLRGVTGA